MTINDKFLTTCELVYIKHERCYPWMNIVKGQCVRNTIFSAVAQNTFRGFHRCNQSLPGAKNVFVNYFCENENRIVREMNDLKTKHEYETLLESVREDVCKHLKNNIKSKQLCSYNKTRKPIDLYFQHLVSMSNETKNLRNKITPFMNLPLDSQIFSTEAIFSVNELKLLGLNRRSSYGDVSSKEVYQKLQQLVLDKCGDISKRERQFYPIYFDLLWGGRINRQGENLFEMNPVM